MSVIILDPLIHFYAKTLNIKPKITTAISKVIVLYELSRIYELRITYIIRYKFRAPEITLQMHIREIDAAMREGWLREFRSLRDDYKPNKVLMENI